MCMFSDMVVMALAISAGVSVFELGAPCAVFGTGRPREVEDWYDFRVCAPAHTPVDKWFHLDSPYGYEDLVTADTVIVPACHDRDLVPPTDLVDAVRAAFEAGARVVSICTGAFVLAEAGLLDGRRATTHWIHAQTLASRYPLVTVDPAVLYIDEGRIMTSAGKSAGTDLCLHLVREDHGAAVANSIARRLVTAPHREGGQAQFISAAPPPTAIDHLAGTMQWALKHISEPITVEDMAEQAHLGTRTLHRHFVKRTGLSPQQWLLVQRVRRAQHLLETSEVGIEVVAAMSGFGSGAALRQHFRRVVTSTPQAYRQSFATDRSS